MDIRRIDHELTIAVRNTTSQVGKGSNLPTEHKYTEMVAAGIFGCDKQQKIALALIKKRQSHKELQRAIR